MQVWEDVLQRAFCWVPLGLTGSACPQLARPPPSAILLLPKGFCREDFANKIIKRLPVA